MSFYVKRNYTPIVLLICAVLGASCYYLVKKTETEKRLKAELSVAQTLKQQENQRKALELRTRILAEKMRD